ncbi:MAG: restriction endonuclease [Desulfobacteraceae bacterium]|nr:restriction endonuclease [Desulfobacteraceae bacterium]
MDNNADTSLKGLLKDIDVDSKKEFIESFATGLLRLIWRAFLNPPETQDQLATQTIDMLLSIIYPHISLTEEELSSIVTRDLYEEMGSNWGISVFTSATFEEYIEKMLSDDSSSDEFYTVLDRAWKTWRPRVAQLSTQFIESVRDIHSEYLLWLKAHTNVIDQIAWEAFEKLVAEIFASRGFSVDLTGRIRNRSADIIAVRTDTFGVQTKYLIECKRYAKSRRIGLDIVNAVMGAARRSNVDHAFLVTSSYFTEDVQRQENQLRDLRLHLRDGDDVVQWLQDYTVQSTGGLWLANDWNSGI